jgi:sialidase-1
VIFSNPQSLKIDMKTSLIHKQAPVRLIQGFIVLLILWGTTAARADAEFSDVFVSGQDGYHTYRIPAVVVTTNATLLAFCEGRKNSGGDSGDIDLLLKRSTDGGRSWSPLQVVWSDGENVCGNPAPVVDRVSGTIWLLMTWNLGSDREKEIEAGTSKDTRHVFATHSDDDGRTWAKPQEITASVKLPGWRWYATGPVNGIQLTRGQHNGRLVIPCNHSELNSQTQFVSRSHIIYSDDHGARWNIGGSEADFSNESTIVERSDGSLLHSMRSPRNHHQRVVGTSMDGGSTWIPASADSGLIDSVCQACLQRCTWPLNGEKSRILFCNPASTKRENLTIRLSYDEGATWPVSKLIQSGPSAYSGLAGLPNHFIVCLFECGEKKSYEKISLVRFPLRWLEDSKE